MSRIFGLACSTDDSEIDSILQRMAAWSHDVGGIETETWSNARCGMGHLSVGAIKSPPQPIELRQGARCSVCCGPVFNCREFQGEFPDACSLEPGHASSAALIDAMLTDGKTDALGRINGLFSFASWDETDGCLRVVNDRYGFRPMFYFYDSASGMLVFSSDLGGIIASGLVGTSVDWSAASAFLYFGHNLGNATLYDGVKALPPASILTFRNGRMSIETYWDPNSIAIDESMSYDDALDGNIEMFRRSIARMRSSGVGSQCVFLSGGLDSRHIAAELARQGADFDTFTTRGFEPGVPDKAPAKNIADALKVRNTFVDLPHNFIQSFWARSSRLLEHETDLHQWILPLVEALPAEYKINYDGIAGDTLAMLRMSDWPIRADELIEQAQSDPPQALADMLLGKPKDLRFLSSKLASRLSHKVAHDCLIGELSRYAPNGNRPGMFILFNRTRRAITLSSMKLLLHKVESFYPFMDNEYFEFNMSIPPQHKLRHDMRRAVLARAYPELKSLEVAHKAQRYVPEDTGARLFDFPSQRQLLHRQRVRELFVRNNWMFRNTRALPHAAKYYFSSSADYMFNSPLVTFLEWLSQHFAKGRGI